MMALFQAGICPLPDAIKSTIVKNPKHIKTAPVEKSETVQSKFHSLPNR